MFDVPQFQIDIMLNVLGNRAISSTWWRDKTEVNKIRNSDICQEEYSARERSHYITDNFCSKFKQRSFMSFIFESIISLEDTPCHL